MEENFDQKELYQIINRALAKCINYENYAVNTEMNIFCNRYCAKQDENTQSSL